MRIDEARHGEAAAAVDDCLAIIVVLRSDNAVADDRDVGCG